MGNKLKGRHKQSMTTIHVRNKSEWNMSISKSKEKVVHFWPFPNNLVFTWSYIERHFVFRVSVKKKKNKETALGSQYKYATGVY